MSRAPRILTLVSVTMLFSLAFSAAWSAEQPTTSTRTRAFIQPAVVTVTTTYSGIVYAPGDKGYVGDNWFVADPGSAHVFTTVFDAVGLVVNSAGIVATSGDDVDPTNEGGNLVEDATAYVKDEWDPSKFPEGASLTDAFKKDLQGLSADNLFDQYQWSLRGPDGGPDLDVKYQITWSSSTGTANQGTQYNAELIDFRLDEGGNVGLLRSDRHNLLAAELAKSGPEPGTPVVVAGLHEGRVLYRSVKAAARSPLGRHETFGLPKFQGETSGAPLVCADGLVCGHTMWRGDKVVGISSTAILSLLRKQGMANELGRSSSAYQRGIRAYVSGDESEAITQLETAARADPDNRFVKSYLAKAQAIEDSMPLWEAIGWILGAAAIPIAAIVGLVALVRRLRRPRPDQVVPPSGPPAPKPGVNAVTGLNWQIDSEITDADAGAGPS